MVDIKLEDEIDVEDIDNQDYQNHNKKDLCKVESSTTCIKDEKEVDAKQIDDIKVERDVKLEDYITEEIEIKEEIIANDGNHEGGFSGNKHDGSELDVFSTDGNSKTANNAKRLCDFCYYCKIDVLHFSRHLKRHHIKEAEVEKIFSLPSKSAERRYLLNVLRKKWNHMRTSKDVRPVRRSRRCKQEYTSCKYCFGYYSSTSVLRHVKKCKLKMGESKLIASLTSKCDVLEKSSMDNPLTKESKGLPVFCYYCKTKIMHFADHLKNKHIDEAEVKKVFSLPPQSRERLHLFAILRKKGAHVKNLEKQSNAKIITVRKSSRLPNFCYYCKTDVLYFALHLKRKHIKEAEVEKIFSLPANSTERRRLLAVLRKKGNYLKSCQGCIKPTKRSKLNDEKYLLCKYCFGYYHSKSLWRHIKKCKLSLSVNESKLKVPLTSVNHNLRKRLKHDKLPDFCYYCKNDVLHFARHLYRHHMKETEVEKIFSLPPKSKERAYLIGILRKKGKHTQILNEQSQPSNGNKYPCKYCFGYYRRKTLWRHVKTCRLNDGSGTSYSHLTDGQNLFVNSVEVDNEFKESVFSRMFADEISLTAKKDILICMYGGHYFRTHQNINCIRVCTRKIRELARLLLEVREVDTSIKTLFELLDPKHYTLVVECTKQITYSGVEKNKCKTFTYACNIYGALKQCCDLAILAVQKNQYVPNVGLQEAESNFNIFKQLLKSTWRSKIFENAESNRYTFDTSDQLLSSRQDRVLVPWTKEQKTLITKFFKNNIKISKPPTESDCELLKQKHPDVFSNKTWKQMKVYIQNIYTHKCRKKERLEKDEDKNKISLDRVNTVKIDNSLEAEIPTPTPNTYKVLRKKNRILVPWTEEQKTLIITFFKNHIRCKKPPRQIECELLKQTHPGVFSNKTWQQMKVYIQNIYTQKQKMIEMLDEEERFENYARGTERKITVNCNNSLEVTTSTSNTCKTLPVKIKSHVLIP